MKNSIKKTEGYEIPLEIRNKFHDVIDKVNVITIQVHNLETASVKLDAAREAAAMEISVIKNDNHHMVRLIESMDGLFRDLVKEVKAGFEQTSLKIEKLQTSNNVITGVASIVKPLVFLISGGLVTYCFKIIGS